MADDIFANPRLAAVYDGLNGDRDDLDHYTAIVEELGALSVLDLGCGTGTFACLLAETGMNVTGVDPAAASLDVAKAKPYADRVQWLLGDATTVLSSPVDVVTMTGNAAQVFLSDAEWSTALAGARRSLRPAGRFVFEVRDPDARGWEDWTHEKSFSRIEIDGAGPVSSWVELTEVAFPLISFRWTFQFEADGSVLSSDSTLRFRERHEIESSLAAAGFDVLDVRDAPDRPGREFVFIARRTT